MNDYLSNLAAKALHLTEVLQPRLDSFLGPRAYDLAGRSLEGEVRQPGTPSRENAKEPQRDTALDGPADVRQLTRGRTIDSTEELESYPAARDQEMPATAPQLLKSPSIIDTSLQPPVIQFPESGVAQSINKKSDHLETPSPAPRARNTQPTPQSPDTPFTSVLIEPHRKIQTADSLEGIDSGATASRHQPGANIVRGSLRTQDLSRLAKNDANIQPAVAGDRDPPPKPQEGFNTQSGALWQRPQGPPPASLLHSSQPARAAAAFRQAKLTQSESVVRVNIGRIEVRAVAPPSPPPKQSARANTPRLSLEEYLKQRNGTKR